MPFRYRKRLRLGPLVLNLTQRGLTSVSIKLWKFTWNPTRRTVTSDLPGGLYHTHRYNRRDQQ
jgi:hypothetical protein